MSLAGARMDGSEDSGQSPRLAEGAAQHTGLLPRGMIDLPGHCLPRPLRALHVQDSARLQRDREHRHGPGMLRAAPTRQDGWSATVRP